MRIRYPTRVVKNIDKPDKDDTNELILKLKKDEEERVRLKNLTHRLELELELIKARKGVQ